MKENKTYIFELCTTINGRYLIMQDNVYDFSEKKLLGNIWESVDMFKTIFNSVETDDSEFLDLRESINKKPLFENNTSLFDLRDILLEFNFFQDTWLGREIKKSGESTTDVFNQSWEGLKKFGVSISKNGWSEILNDIGRGVKFVFRKLKDALYSNIGIIVDAILVSTGVGKSVQWIPWAMVFSLDLYQISNNDWESELSPTEQWLELLFSSLGLLFAGGVAKTLRGVLKPLSKDPRKLTQTIRNNKKLTSLLTNLKSKLPNVGNLLTKLQQTLKNKFKMGSDFITKSLGYFKNVITKFNQFIDSLLGNGKLSKGIKSGGVTSGVLYGLDNNDLTVVQKQNLNTLMDLEKEMDNLFEF